MLRSLADITGLVDTLLQAITTKQQYGSSEGADEGISWCIIGMTLALQVGVLLFMCTAIFTAICMDL